MDSLARPTSPTPIDSTPSTPRRPAQRQPIQARRHSTAWLVLAALFGLLFAGPVAAFEIESYVIAPGGGSANQSGWDLTATLGQPVAGTSQGGTFELRAGFWAADFIVEPPIDALFSDRFQETAPDPVRQRATDPPEKQPEG